MSVIIVLLFVCVYGNCSDRSLYFFLGIMLFFEYFGIE